MYLSDRYHYSLSLIPCIWAIAITIHSLSSRLTERSLSFFTLSHPVYLSDHYNFLLSLIPCIWAITIIFHSLSARVSDATRGGIHFHYYIWYSLTTAVSGLYITAWNLKLLGQLYIAIYIAIYCHIYCYILPYTLLYIAIYIAIYCHIHCYILPYCRHSYTNIIFFIVFLHEMWSTNKKTALRHHKGHVAMKLS